MGLSEPCDPISTRHCAAYFDQKHMRLGPVIQNEAWCSGYHKRVLRNLFCLRISPQPLIEHLQYQKMPGLDQRIRVLPPLPYETPPSVPDLITQISPWVFGHLQTKIRSGVHFEHQLYGDFNSFLTSIFPTKRMFMIKPQGLLRKVLEDVDENMDVSFSSTGGCHESRNLRMSPHPQNY
jgi:hypothetical protein